MNKSKSADSYCVCMCVCVHRNMRGISGDKPAVISVCVSTVS